MSESRRAGGKASAKKPWAGEKFPVKPAGIYRGTHFRTGEVGYFYSTHEHGWRGPFPTAREANAHRHDYQDGRRHGPPVRKPEPMTFGQFLAERYLPARPGSPATLKRREGDVTRIRKIRPQFLDLLLTDVSPVELDLLRRAHAIGKNGTAYAPGTQNRTMRFVHAVMNYAVADGKLATWDQPNPMLRTTKVKAPSDLDVQRMLRAVDAKRSRLYRAPISLVVLTGLRSGEVRGLAIENVPALTFDMRAERWSVKPEGPFRVIVETQLLPDGTFGPLKSDGPERWVPISAEGCEMLAEHLNTYGPGPRLHGRALLFTGRKVQRAKGWIDWNTLTRTIERACTRGGAAPFTMHQLRHYYASVCARAGVPPKELQRRMGHANFKITMDLYADFYEGDTDDPAAGVLTALVRTSGAPAPAAHQHPIGHSR